MPNLTANPIGLGGPALLMPGKRAPAPKARRRPGEARPQGLVKAARRTYVPKTAGPTSTESPRLKAVHAELGRRMKALFPEAEAVFLYGMHGWRVPRRRKVEWITGTIDPNWLVVAVAERAQGITLHLWDPVEWDVLANRKDGLRAAGFKVMKGCLQFTRKADYPVEAVGDLLTYVQQGWEADGDPPA